MRNESKSLDPLPDEFTSIEEAAEFWDAHSITDYAEFPEPVDPDVDIRRCHFEIAVDAETFLALRQAAEREQKPIKKNSPARSSGRGCVTAEHTSD